MKSSRRKYLLALLIISTFPPCLFGQVDAFKIYLEKSHQFEKTNLDSSFFYLDLAKTVAVNNGDEDQFARSLLWKGHLHKNKGEYNRAIQNCFEALETFENNNDYKHIVRAKSIIGASYTLLKNYSLAKEYFLSAIETGEEQNEVQVSPYQGYGNVLYYQDSIKEAEEVYLRVIDLIEETDETSATMTAGILTNLGNIKFMQDDLESAKRFYQEAYQLYAKTENTLGICITAYNIGEVYYKLEDYVQAEAFLMITLKNGRELGSIDDIQFSLQSLSDVYKKQEKFEIALEYTEMYYRFRDSIYEKNHQEQIDKLHLKYSSVQNESKIKEQHEIIKSAKEEKIQGEHFSRSLLGGILGLGAIVVIMIISYVKIKKRNTIIEESKIEIDNNLKEKELLLKEIHHRVKNNLQMISSLLNLQSHRLNNKDAVKALDESKNRVQAIALVHQKLYQNVNISEISLSNYIQDLSQLMGQFFDEKNQVKYNFDIGEIKLNVDTMVPLGLIICELISNSQKHAFENILNAEISIKIKENIDNSLTLEYRDNGKGLPNDFSIENLNSLGFEIIESLSEQLNGELTIHTKFGILIQLNFHKV